METELTSSITTVLMKRIQAFAVSFKMMMIMMVMMTTTTMMMTTTVMMMMTMKSKVTQRCQNGGSDNEELNDCEQVTSLTKC